MTKRKDTEALITQAAKAVRDADALLVCAGAGIGVDSGLPDFRGDEGFWKAYPPFAKLGLNFIDMANPGWFEQDPELAWGFYGHRLNLYRQTTPHKGFDFLLKWGQSKAGGYFVFTSNVDGQFQKTGFHEDCILECHGSIHHFQCIHPGCSAHIWSAHGVEVTVDESTMRAQKPLPACPACQSIARPNILMFGDWSWLGDRSEDQYQRYSQWLQDNRDTRIAIVECGAGTGVPTVRMTSERIGASYNNILIRINTREPFVPPKHIGISLGALETLEKIDSHVL
ncbi:MAG: NAD-dependent deacetylase [Candidatus Aminicenantes bacterium]|nr:MAG: NAD-dependent deacetylase [Candidatus Aminicenantes bacterium]